MVNRKRYVNRKGMGRIRRRGRRGFGGIGKFTLGQTLSYLRKGYGYMKRMINAERSGFDTKQTGLVPTSTASIYALTDMKQGDDITNRRGDSILCDDVLLRLFCANNATSLSNVLRVILFADTSCSAGTAPTASQLLQDTSTYLSPLNDAIGGRFLIIYDQLITVSSTGNTFKTIKTRKKLGFHNKFSGTGTGTYDKNSLFLFLMSGDVTNGPSVHFYTRVHYYDN